MPTPTSKASLGSAAKRGRPRLDENKAIALTVDRLIGWGYEKRRVVGPVARAVRSLFPERDVSAEAVEQIWKRERRRAKERALARPTDDIPNDEPLLGWARYWPKEMLRATKLPDRRILSTVEERRARRPAHPPGMTIEEMARVLLRNGGSPFGVLERSWSPLERKHVETPIGAHLYTDEKTGGHKSRR